MPLDPAFFADRTLRVPDDSLGFLLWRATHGWQRFVEQALAPTGLTHLRFTLLVGLAWLTHRGEAVTQRRLADFLRMQPMQVSQVLAALDAAGLVRRRPAPDDRRAFALTLTARGVGALTRALPLVERAHAAYFAAPGLDPAEVTRVLRALAEQGDAPDPPG